MAGLAWAMLSAGKIAKGILAGHTGSGSHDFGVDNLNEGSVSPQT